MKSMKYLSVCAAALLSLSSAQAALIGTIDHDYGSSGMQVGTASLGGGSCDTLNANSVTVRSNTTGCQRFFDQFDFSAFDGVVDSFTLTMDFEGSQNGNFGLERWSPRPASSTSNGSAQGQTYLNGVGPQSWTFDSTLDVFNDIVAGGSFYLWMSRDLLYGVQSVNLDYARLEVYGTPNTPPNGVPEPGSLALVAAGFLMIPVAQRYRRKQAA